MFHSEFVRIEFTNLNVEINNNITVKEVSDLIIKEISCFFKIIVELHGLNLNIKIIKMKGICKYFLLNI